MKSLNTAFSFAPPSILSLTIYRKRRVCGSQCVKKKLPFGIRAAVSFYINMNKDEECGKIKLLLAKDIKENVWEKITM